MYKVQVYYLGAGTMYFRSRVEPKWIKDSKGRVKLRVELLEDEEIKGETTYLQRPLMPIYRDIDGNQVIPQVSFSFEEITDPEEEEKKEAKKTIEINQKLLTEELDFLDFLQTVPNYTQIRDYTSWSQKKTRETLMGLTERGLIEREKSGRSSFFSLTTVGEKYLASFEKE